MATVQATLEERLEVARPHLWHGIPESKVYKYLFEPSQADSIAARMRETLVDEYLMISIEMEGTILLL